MIKLGIIGAMAIEIETLKAQMADVHCSVRTGMEFWEGKLEGLDAVVVQCGVGKVNAAMCAQTLCSCYGVTHLVNTGIAGSLSAQLDIGDLVVSRDAMYHDFDCVHFGYEMGKVPGMDVVSFPADETLIRFAQTAAETVNPGHCRLGRIASGDQFVAEKPLKEQIIATCPNTILSYILENNMTEVLELGSFADLYAIIDKFPQQMQDDYYLALSFSKFLIVARTLYNIMISDGQNVEANEYFEVLKEEMVDRANIDIDKIISQLYIYKTDLKNFLKQLQACMLNADVDGMKQAIKAREILLKGANRAKTAHPGEFDIDEWYGGGALDYRFTNAKIIIKDIFESEGLIDVKSEQ